MKAQKPPYVPIGWIENFLELVRRIKLDKVDRHVLDQYNVVDLGNSSKVVGALKFLGLIDENGRIIKEKVSALRLEGTARTEKLQEIIKTAYSDLFDKIDLANARSEDINNYFIGCGYSSNLASGASKLFLRLAQKANIELSDALKNMQVSAKKGSLKKQTVTNKSSLKKYSTAKNEPASDVMPLTEGTISINVRGKGVSMNLDISNLKDIEPNLAIISQIIKLHLNERTKLSESSE